VHVDAGGQAPGSFSVANLTDKPLGVHLYVKQFSVSDYQYNYTFSDPAHDFVTLALTDITLQPNKSQAIPFTVNTPQGAAPGGYYYTLFAQSAVAGDVSVATQVATLLYVTVNGKLVQTTELKQHWLQQFIFGGDISYTLEPLNTGNVHYYAYVSATLDGFLTHQSMPPTPHLLLPGAVRHVAASLPSPFLPGVYKVTYGYRTDAGDVVTRSGLVIFVPPWFIAVVVGLVLAGNIFYRYWQKRCLTRQPKG